MFNVSSLEVAHLTYSRNQRLLFRDLSFQACQGELIQIEGANGAGKTTLFRLLAGLVSPESGQILWCGVAIKKQWDTYQQQLIYLGHLSGNKSVLTVFENLAFYQSLQGDMNEVQIWQALEQVDLLGYEDVPVMQLSAGQQRRVALARLWLNSATLWILDEPLTAIDQRGVSRLLELFEQHQQRGGIILLTTHQDFDYTRRKLRLGGEA